ISYFGTEECLDYLCYKVIVNPRKIIEIRDLYLKNVKSSIDESVDKLFDENLFIQEWQLDFQEALKDNYIVCFALANGGIKNLTDSILQEIGDILKNEYQLLYDFAVELAEGKYHHNDITWGKEHAKLRARAFLDSVIS
ncbi:MAG: hypothetical protein KJ069_11790, partial [Anaerolineae bacterium]|nr:hypothetical protein [Anaerolineae bacterium]